MCPTKRNPPPTTGSSAHVTDDDWPRGIIWKGGFKLNGTSLGFPGYRDLGILFCPTIDSPLPPKGVKGLMSPEVAAAHDVIGCNRDALILEPGRRIKLGKLDLGLWPCGTGPGATMLEIRMESRRILYCRSLRRKPPLLGLGAAEPECDLLILDLEPSSPRPPSPAAAAKKLVSWADDLRGSSTPSCVVCSSKTSALEAIWALGKSRRISAARPIYEMAKRLGITGDDETQLVRLNQDWPDEGVVVHLAALWPVRAQAFDSSIPTAYVGPGKELPPWAQIGFRFAEGEDNKSIGDFVKSTGARTVVLGPSSDGKLAHALGKMGTTVHRISSPAQIPLPFDS